MTAGSIAPITLEAGEGETRWFLGGLATIKASGETTDGRVAVIENHAPKGHGSPLHIHRNEDEWFYVTDGELTFWVGGQVIYGQDRVVRLRPARRTAHLHRHLAGGPLPARRRARRLRELPACALRAGRDADTPTGNEPASRSGSDDGHRRRVRLEIIGPPGIPA